MKIIDILINDIDLSIELISLYWPFTENELQRYRDVLRLGSGHYAVYLNDTESVYEAEFGLSFNQHLHWTPWLRSDWDCGFWDPFCGEFVGLGEPCEYDERHLLSSNLPLSVINELEARNRSYESQYFEWNSPEDESFDPESVCLDLEPFRHVYPRLSDQQFSELLQNSRDVVLLNPSVWRNTLASEVTPDIFSEIIRLKRIENTNLLSTKLLSKARTWPAEFKAAVGDLLRAGVILPNDYTQGTEWRKIAADEGSADAQYKMASQSGSKDEHLAWYTLAAEQGHRKAQYELGTCYKTYSHWMPNAKNVLPWLIKAAEQGHTEAAYLLGKVHTNSFGSIDKCDCNIGLLWLTKAAEKGYADAQYTLGRLYLVGLEPQVSRGGIFSYEIIKGVEKNPHKAIPWLLKAADQKHSEATCLLGSCYSTGAGVEKNKFLAFRYYLDAANQGDCGAQYAIAECYENGIGTEQNFDECLRWYITAAIHRSERACHKLGCDHTTGSREPPVDVSFHLSWYVEDHQMGARDQYCVRDELKGWFSEAAEKGSIAAKFILGVIKINGQRYWLGTDKKAGFLLLNEAAKHGLYIAEYWVGKCYEEGLGVSPNMELAVAFYWRASANGFKEAQYSLGRCYQKGLGVSEDYDLSFQMFAKAANQYHRDAASCLGSCGDNAGYFLLGEGYLHNQNSTDLCLGYSPVKNTSWCGPGGSVFLKNKLNDIFEWHLNAAKQDSALAQYNAAYFYIHGIGVEQDHAEAVKWLTKAAEAGHTLAQYQLGCCYLRGEGVSMDLKMMVKWFAKASEAEDPIINEAMKEIKEKELWALIEHEVHS